MFAMRGASDLGRKRGRDDEDDGTSSGGLSFGEHRTKRLQCLPLRTSPSQPVHKRWSAPSFPPTSVPATSQPHTITPGDSDSEEAQQRQQQPASHFSPWSSSPTPSDPPGLGFSQPPSDADDMMLDVASPTSSSMHQGHDVLPPVDNLVPGPFHPEAIASTIAGRMPTPIQPSFSAQVRGVWGGPGPALNYQQHPNGVHNMGHQYDSMLGAEDPTVPRTLGAANAEWMGVHSRRLPSPISEGEDMCSPTASAGLASPGMVLDAGGRGMSDHLNACLHMQRRESFGAAIPREVGMMDVEDGEPGMVTTTLTQTMSAPAEPNSAPATPSPGRKGHIRSRHTVNSWTWQPGMKKSFSIGYRADCEKCRMKVPGHFNHIIIS